MLKVNVKNVVRAVLPRFVKQRLVLLHRRIGAAFNIDMLAFDLMGSNGSKLERGEAPYLKAIAQKTQELADANALVELAIEQRNAANLELLEARKEVLEARRPADIRAHEIAVKSIMLSHRLSRLVSEARWRGPRRVSAFDPSSDGSDRERVCIIYSAHTQFFHFKELLAGLIARGSVDIVVFSFISAKDHEMFDLCRSYNVIVIENGNFLTEYVTGLYDVVEDESLMLKPRDLAYYRSTTAISNDELVSGMVAEVARQTSVERYIRSVIGAMNIVSILMFEENAETDSTIWTSVARREGVPCVIIPYTIADKTEPAESHHHDDLFWAESDNLFNRYVARHLPLWTFRFKERTLIRRPGLVALVNEMLGHSQPDPWVLNSSRSALIAVESPRMMKHYVDLNIDPSHLIMTGSFSDDVLSRASGDVDAIKAELGLDPEKKILLCAFPPNQLTATRSACQFEAYEDIIDFWLGCLATLTDWQVVVAPHPLTDQAHIDLLRAKGYVTSMAPVSRLIAIADVYNASVSSTIRWALALGKPVINFDVFQYRYVDFIGVPGVKTVTESVEFEQAIDDLANDPAFFAELSDAAQRNAADWGLVDGRSGERILDLICDVSGQQGRRRGASGSN